MHQMVVNLLVLFHPLLQFHLLYFVSSTCGTAQRQLEARTWVAGSAPEGDISTGIRVPAELFPVSSKACL